MQHYEILGVPPDADEAAINAAFRREAKLAHPDHGGDERRFNRLFNARRALLAAAKTKAVHQRPAVTAIPTRPPHYEPKVPRGPTTTFNVGPSPFAMPPAKFPFTELFQFPGR